MTMKILSDLHKTSINAIKCLKGKKINLFHVICRSQPDYFCKFIR